MHGADSPPYSGSREIQFRTRHRAAGMVAPNHQDASVRQADGRMPGTACDERRPGAPIPGEWVVDLGAGQADAIRSSGYKHAPICEQGGGMRGPGGGECSNLAPTSLNRVIHFSTG